MKDQSAIIKKLGIAELNPMQLEAGEVISSHSEIVLLSPTGTGKTLAFLLPVIASLNPKIQETQVLILVPSRELAIQIEQVSRELGSGYKINSVYGGKSSSKDKMELKTPPAILIGTPGRVADHFRRKTMPIDQIKTLVLDEFDKSLEVGFESEMKEIVSALHLKKKILTSATMATQLPRFVGIKEPKVINYLTDVKDQLSLKMVVTSAVNKLPTLIKLLAHVGNGNGIIFCNFKETIQLLSDYLHKNKIDHASFYGGLEQIDRERALIKFRNGTQKFLIATDLAARGIDVPALDFIIHYQLPMKEAEFIHRNGRTARMNCEGTAYLIKTKEEALPNYIKNLKEEVLASAGVPVASLWETLYISGGRKDKISKGDIAGLFIKQGKLTDAELGVIELKQDSAFVAVPKAKAKKLVQQLNNTRLKTKKVRIAIME